MSKELTTPPNFMENIREKIKNSFVELVPDETWDAMVQQEITAFFEAPTNFEITTKTESGWGQATKTTVGYKFDDDLKPTMFRTMVWDMCAEETWKHLDSEYIQKIVHIALEQRRDEATGYTESLIQKAVPIMVNKYFESIAINMVNNLESTLRSNIENGTYQRF